MLEEVEINIEIKIKCKACITSNKHMGGSKCSIKCWHY